MRSAVPTSVATLRQSLPMGASGSPDIQAMNFILGPDAAVRSVRA